VSGRVGKGRQRRAPLPRLAVLERLRQPPGRSELVIPVVRACNEDGDAGFSGCMRSQTSLRSFHQYLPSCRMPKVCTKVTGYILTLIGSNSTIEMNRSERACEAQAAPPLRRRRATRQAAEPSR